MKKQPPKGWTPDKRSCSFGFWTKSKKAATFFRETFPKFSHLCSEVSRKHGEEKMFLNNHSIEKIRKDHEKSGNVSEDQEIQKKFKSQFDLVFPFYLKSNAHSNAHPGHP